MKFEVTEKGFDYLCGLCKYCTKKEKIKKSDIIQFICSNDKNTLLLDSDNDKVSCKGFTKTQ